MRKKSSTITVWVRDDLKERADYLKTQPGGLTKFIEDALEALDIPREKLEAFRLIHGGNA